MKVWRAAAIVSLLAGGVCEAQSRPPYVQRGDELEKRDSLYRADLQRFFRSFQIRVAHDAPDLLPKIEPPAPVPYGYQIIPKLLPDKPRRAANVPVRLSPFSWRRTGDLLTRDSVKLDSLKRRLSALASASDTATRAAFVLLAADYKKLVDGQKLIENQIQYNRFWQGEFALHPQNYKNVKALQKAAIDQQALKDSAAAGDDRLKAKLQPRIDSLENLLAREIQKDPTPGFIRLDHPDAHHWIVNVPVYTDITDSMFVETFRDVVENAWHVTDGADDFRVKVEIKRMTPSTLYPHASLPEQGAHIDEEDHLKRFPPDGVALTTGAQTTHVRGRGIVLGPHAIARGVLAHEFGHQLGFKDGYFRSYEDRGAEGYEILEVILPPAEGVPAPEAGWVRRENFDQIIRERQK